jgi:predicted nuclease with TOPRIM domain
VAEDKKAPPELEIRKPDLQMLLQDQAAIARMHAEERRQHERQIKEERELSHWREERTRAELTEKVHDLEHQNAALVRTLGHLQGEVDRLREELAIEKGKHFTEPPDLKDAKSPTAAGGMPLVNTDAMVQGLSSPIPTRPLPTISMAVIPPACSHPQV